MKRQLHKALRKSCNNKSGHNLGYSGINARLKHVFESIILELERRNLSWPDLLEEYDRINQKNALLIREKDHFFHTMQDWRSQYLNIEKWRKFAFEALLYLPQQYQVQFIQKLHELEEKDRDIQDRRMKELFGNK